VHVVVGAPGAEQKAVRAPDDIVIDGEVKGTQHKTRSGAERRGEKLNVAVTV